MRDPAGPLARTHLEHPTRLVAPDQHARDEGVVGDWHQDLNMRGMMANQKLTRNIGDIGVYEFRRQLEYKAKPNGEELVIAICACGARPGDQRGGEFASVRTR